jgi:hypothetical protein
MPMVCVSCGARNRHGVHRRPGDFPALHRAAFSGQVAQTETVGDEIRLFGAYLKTRLSDSMFLDEEGRRLTLISFADFHLKFDEVMELRKRHKDVPSRWIAHSVLSLTNDQLIALDHVLATAHERWPRPGHFGRAVYYENGTAICIVTAVDHRGSVLRDQANRVAMIEKFRRKAN